ncbi:MAG: AMP-binding protein [Spirochaetales bacterium]|nr:AMP-binding protein [Spirochaetales bacterium]
MPRLNLTRSLLEPATRARPDHPALVFYSAGAPAFECTYRNLDLTIRRQATQLKRLVPQAGERVVIRLRHGPRFAVAFFAANAAGLVPVPLSPALVATEVSDLIEDSQPALILFEKGLPLPECAVPCLDILELEHRSRHDLPEPYADTDAEEPAFLVYTSGTGGKPRGVLHAQRSVLGRRPMLSWTGLGPDDRMLHAGQLNWTYTLGVGVMDPWSVGATAILYQGPSDPALWPDLIQRSRATVFATVPALFRRVLKYGDVDLISKSALRHALAAGEPLAPSLLEEWRRKTGREMYEALGMSEVSTYVSSGPSVAVRPGFAGRAQPGRRITILRREAAAKGRVEFCSENEVGLLAVHRSDPGLMLRYWRRPELDEKVYRGDWFVGGDVARMTGGGYIAFVGRDDEIMNCSGYRVSPIEVEQVLARCSGISEVAVRSFTLKTGAQIVAAFVVPAGKNANSGELSKRLARHANQNLAPYKRPREYVFCEKLPRTTNGKLQRNRLHLPESDPAPAGPATNLRRSSECCRRRTLDR